MNNSRIGRVSSRLDYAEADGLGVTARLSSFLSLFLYGEKNCIASISQGFRLIIILRKIFDYMCMQSKPMRSDCNQFGVSLFYRHS